MFEIIKIQGSESCVRGRLANVRGGRVSITPLGGTMVEGVVHAKSVAVLSFGWLHFKDCCARYGHDWGAVRYLSRSSDLVGLDPQTTAVIFDPSCSDERMAKLVRQLESMGYVNGGAA